MVAEVRFNCRAQRSWKSTIAKVFVLGFSPRHLSSLLSLGYSHRNSSLIVARRLSLFACAASAQSVLSVLQESECERVSLCGSGRARQWEFVSSKKD